MGAYYCCNSRRSIEMSVPSPLCAMGRRLRCVRSRRGVRDVESANDGGGGKKRGESPQSEDCGYRVGSRRAHAGMPVPQRVRKTFP